MFKISVIIPSVNGLPTLAECLAALVRQVCDFDFEIIVVDRTQNETSQYITEHFPQVVLIKLSESCGIPEMRAMAMKQARGEFIVVTEDHCLAPKNWLAKILKTHDLGYSVIGGAVENGSRNRLIDWAVFLCEYSNFMPPIAGGEVEFLTGNNTSYQRSVLEQVDDDVKQNYWEFFLQKELQLQKVKFVAVPELVISHKKEFDFLYFLSQRFHYSRSFAAMRRNQSTFAQQLFYLIYIPILPFHQIAKVGKNVYDKQRNYREFILTLPILMIFMCSYALGEFIGQIFGSGDSLLKVE